MKIALVNPASPFLVRQDVHGPLGLWYIGAVLKAQGHVVNYHELGLGDLILDADMYGITATTPQWQYALEAYHHIRDHCDPAATVVFGGAHVTVKPEDVPSFGNNVIVMGEGEQVVLDAFIRATSTSLIRASRIEDLDLVGFPDRSDNWRFHYTIDDRDGSPISATTMISSRGCPHSCSFCSKAIWGRTYRERSATNVLAEAETLLENHDYQAIHFFDDSFCTNHKRLSAICEGLRDMGIIWRCFARADQLNPDILALMSASGCVEIGLGVESGSPAILARCNKKESVEQQAQAIRWIKKAGIRVKAFVIVGLPGENWHTIDETAKFLEEAKPDDLDSTILQIYPGSAIYDYPSQYNITVHSDATWYKGTPGQYQAHHSTEELKYWQMVAARDYIEARYKAKTKGVLPD